MSRYQQSSNPFEDNDDDDDGDFVVVRNEKSTPTGLSTGTGCTATGSGSKPNVIHSNGKPSMMSQSRRQPQPASNPYSTNWNDPAEDDNPFESRRQHLQRQIENSENNQLESTQRALASIYDSEAMGVATSEELMRQGETLDNIETKTDTIQQNLKVSQRHLNNIKSVFGGIKNWWHGDKDKKVMDQKDENATAKLQNAVNVSQKNKPDFSGFYDEEGDLDSQFMARAPKTSSGGGQYTFIEPVTRSAREEEVDENLTMMCDGMSRLKGLAMGLGDEIGRQNEQLDRINNKVVGADTRLSGQNREMRRILKK